MSKADLYQTRLDRYVTTMRNGQADMVPIRPFVAELTAKYAGFTCQQVTHDYELAYEAAVRCAQDFDWDAVVANMVWVWTGLTQALGLKYYAIPGIDISSDTGFQYREPPEEQAFMQADEYDQLIDDPTGFLYNVWLPRVSSTIVGSGQQSSYASNLSLVKGSMAMLSYFMSLGGQIQRLRDQCGTVSAIAGILKAPLDIIADKFRGYLGMLEDLQTQPAKVQAACEALAPHLLNVALTTADPARQVPVGFWMHRGGVPFVNPQTFNNIFWPTLRPIIEELWANDVQTLFYAEGNWDYHLETFAQLPERSIVYHIDQGDIHKVGPALGERFCLSGGIPNALLAYGTPDKVRARCKEVIDALAPGGGYIMDASAIMQNDTSIENLKAMTEFTREYGVYSSSSTSSKPVDSVDSRSGDQPFGKERFETMTRSRIAPGVCEPWESKLGELPEILGDQAIVKDIWEKVEGLGNMFIWQVLLSF